MNMQLYFKYYSISTRVLRKLVLSTHKYDYQIWNTWVVLEYRNPVIDPCLDHCFNQATEFFIKRARIV